MTDHTSQRRAAAVRKIKTRYRRFLRSNGVPEFVIRRVAAIFFQVDL